MIASHHSFGLLPVGPILGVWRAASAPPAAAAPPSFLKFVDKTRLRIYQVSIQIHLASSTKNLVKTEEN
jgi:hypothetical protein